MFFPIFHEDFKVHMYIKIHCTHCQNFLPFLVKCETIKSQLQINLMFKLLEKIKPTECIFGALYFSLANLPPLYTHSSLLHCSHPSPPGYSESPVVPFHPMFYIITIDTITEDPIYRCFIVIILILFQESS